MLDPVRILFATSELFPLAKTGGLADVAASLPKALAREGADVELIMPGYEEALDKAEALCDGPSLDGIPGAENARLLRGRVPDSGLPVWFLDAPQLFRDGSGLYTEADGTDRANNPLRFAAFCHAVTRMGLGRTGTGRIPDIVHANDWHTGLVPMMMELEAGQRRPATVFTVHNLAFQGHCGWDWFPKLGLPGEPRVTQAMEFYGVVNFMKPGLCFADAVTTVSPTYAREILTPEFGCGLEGVIGTRADDLYGVLNGIDSTIWDPARSPWLRTGYSGSDISGKRVCKEDVQRELGLDINPDAPLLAFVGRLTWQKMADVLARTLPDILKGEPDRQFIVLGQGDREIEDSFHALHGAFPGRLGIEVGYSERAAHRALAACDILVHGSRYEPCGLTQLYAMKFGAIPLVRPVGGLADTVTDATEKTLADGTATGFYFHGQHDEAKLEGIDRAVSFYRHDLAWRRLQLASMATDFGWDRSARAYLSIYAHALKRRLRAMRMPKNVQSHDLPQSLSQSLGEPRALTA